MFPHRFGTPHAVRIEAPQPIAVLIEGFRRSSWPIETNDLGSTLGGPVRHQDDVASRHLRVLNTDPESDCSGQVKTDTPLSNQRQLFIFIGTNIPEIRMLPCAIVLMLTDFRIFQATRSRSSSWSTG